VVIYVSVIVSNFHLLTIQFVHYSRNKTVIFYSPRCQYYETVFVTVGDAN